HDEGDVRDEAVAETEDGGPGRAPPDVAVVVLHRGALRELVGSGHSVAATDGHTVDATRQRTSTVRRSWARTARLSRSRGATTAPGHTTQRSSSPCTRAPAPTTERPPEAVRLAAR